MNKNVIAIIDGAIGSCGKGKVIGEVATDKSINLGASISNCMPNAGHTFVNKNGKKTIFKNIPVASANPKTELFIGPGSKIDMETFIDEYNKIEYLLNDRKIYVHELVGLVEDRHKQYEKKHIKSGSTYTGCGAALQEKIIRDSKLKFFKGYKNAIVCSNDEYLERLYKHLENLNEYVLLEIPQGCGLSLNYSGHYPYVTSRDISTTQFLNYSGISAERLLQTIMVIRPFPIRISNITNDGKIIYTGNFGKNVSPLTWTQINLAFKNNSYPHLDDVDMKYYIDEDIIKQVKKLIENSTKESLKQIFEKNYKSINLNKISLLEILELERLFYKNQKITEYKSNFIQEYIRDLSEQTTVTKKERRIGDLDINDLKNYCLINSPYGLYLNFFQHLSFEYEHETGNFENYYFNRYHRNYFNWLELETKTDILALGTGEKNNERILKKQLIKR